MNLSTHSTSKYIFLYLSCLLVMFVVEYVLVNNSISFGFVVFSSIVCLYFVITLIFRDKLVAFLKRTLLNRYIDIIVRLIIMALHLYITSRLFDVIVSANPDLSLNSIYILIINLPIFSLVTTGYSNRS